MFKKLFTFLWKPIKNFNIETRAHKVISQSKPKPAPKYKSDIQSLEKYLKDNPSIIDELTNKNPALDNRLKNVYVTSTDPDPENYAINIESSRYDPNRPLPQYRGSVDLTLSANMEIPTDIKPGFISLADVYKIISNKTKPLVTDIAQMYKIEEKDANNIIKYYGGFNVSEQVKKSKKPTVSNLFYVESEETKLTRLFTTGDVFQKLQEKKTKEDTIDFDKLKQSIKNIEKKKSDKKD